MEPPLIHDAARPRKYPEILGKGVEIPDIDKVFRHLFLNEKARTDIAFACFKIPLTKVFLDKFRVTRRSLFDKVSILIIDSSFTLSTAIYFREMPVAGE